MIDADQIAKAVINTLLNNVRDFDKKWFAYAPEFRAAILKNCADGITKEFDGQRAEVAGFFEWWAKRVHQSHAHDQSPKSWRECGHSLCFSVSNSIPASMRISEPALAHAPSPLS